MNITQENVDQLNAVLKVEVSEKDYADTVLQTLKSHQKQAKMQGFRPGKVPFGLIKKMYGTSVKVEEINKLINSNIFEYINKEKLNVLGQPLPKETDATVNWANDKDFTFEYEIGLAPEFDVKLTAKKKFTEYTIEPDASLIDNYVEEMAMRYGKVSNPDDVSEKDIVTVDVTELVDGEPKEEGIAKMVSVSVDKINLKKDQKLFIGAKKDDIITTNFKKIYKEASEVAGLLDISEEELKAAGDEWQVQISSVSRMEPAELNQEFFDKVYGEGAVSSVEEFRNKVKEEAKGMLGGQGKVKFKNDVIEYLVENTKFDLPDDFLKRWLVAASEKPTTLEQISSEYDNYKKSLKWQLIENKIVSENDIKVEEEEVKNKAKELIKANFAQYGQTIDDESILDSYAANVLAKEEERRRLYDDIYSDKVVEFVKDKCKIEEKEISYDDFVKLGTK